MSQQIDVTKISEDFKEDVASFLAANPQRIREIAERMKPGEKFADASELLQYMTRYEFMDAYLQWHGILGWTHTILKLCGQTAEARGVIVDTRV